MNFLKYTPLYFAISLILIITSVFSLVRWQLKPAIDFTGGSLIEYQFSQSPQISQIREIINQQPAIDLSGLQTASNNKLIIKTNLIEQTQATQLQQSLQQQLNQVITLNRFESIGPVLGQELLTKMLIAVALTALFILAYIAWTFKNGQYGFSAIIAMLHDSIILLGSFSLLGHLYQIEVDSLFVTAVLTALSFSVHDTVVVFDRIRESGKQHPQLIRVNPRPRSLVSQFTSAADARPNPRKSKQNGFEILANKALTETMSRSLNNSLTIIFMLTALLILGGESLKWFITALLIGTIIGTYSSPFVAVPILVTWHQWQKNKHQSPNHP